FIHVSSIETVIYGLFIIAKLAHYGKQILGPVKRQRHGIIRAFTGMSPHSNQAAMASINHSELITLRDWLRYAVSRFTGANLQYGQGSDNAWDEAVYLLLHSLQLPLDTL